MPDNPKILHLISSLRRGGRERQLATLYRYSNPAISTLRIVCFNRSQDSYVEEYGMENDVIYLSSRSPLQRFSELRKIIWAEKPDLIWTWGGFEATFGLLLALFTPVKHINGSVRHGIVRFNRKQLWRMLVLHLSHHIVANSRAGLRANRLNRGFVLYNGIDEKFFNMAKSLREHHVFNDVPIMISVANLVPYKDYATILRALKFIKDAGIDFKYRVVGDGPNRNAILNQISNDALNDHVELLGRCSNVAELLTRSDLFIHSSMGEGCSNAIIEAMACGLPVVATDTGGTSEILNEDFGLMFKYGDPEELADLLKKMILSRQKWSKMGDNAHHRAYAQFNTEKMMREYISIIRNVTGK